MPRRRRGRRHRGRCRDPACLAGTGRGGMAPLRLLAPLFAAALLAGVSWLDDMRGLSPAGRLLVQIVAVVIGMLALAPALRSSRLAAARSYGRDGRVVAVVRQSVQLHGRHRRHRRQRGGGDRLRAPAVRRAGSATTRRWPGSRAAVVAAALGFLVWNWAPARIFLGDVGSVPLGYLLGFLLLRPRRAALEDRADPAALFPGRCDDHAVARLARGERVWQAHRQHFYQRAVQRGLGHAAVVCRVIAADPS